MTILTFTITRTFFSTINLSCRENKYFMPPFLFFLSEVSPWDVKRKIIIISCFRWAQQTDHKVNLDFQEKCALHHLLKIFIKLECCLFSYSSHKCSLTIKFDKFLIQLNNYDKTAFLYVLSALIIYCYHLWQFISLDLL